MIDITNLSKSYNGYSVLKNVNMRLEKGQVIGFVGENGSGKSVLLKMICGFVRPDSGKIIVQGKEIGKDLDFPDKTGIMIEEPGFFQAYSARQNMRLFAAHRNKLSYEEIDDFIKMVGLEPKDRKTVGKYSMGMRQRLCFAQAFMEDPDLLILDEPFNALDKKWVEWMKNKIKSYSNKNRLVILTSHRQEDIDELCTTSYFFENCNVFNIRLNR